MIAIPVHFLLFLFKDANSYYWSCSPLLQTFIQQSCTLCPHDTMLDIPGDSN